MTCLIIAESYDSEKVYAFGRRLFQNPLEATALADALFRGAPFTGTAAAVVRDFEALSAWEKAGVLDELRDALDKLLEQRFWTYTQNARLGDDRKVAAGGASA